MANQFLSFTSSSYAYDSTIEKSKERLKCELLRVNTKAMYYGLVDVSSVPDGSEIYHDDITYCYKNGVKTSCGMTLPVLKCEL